MPIAVPDQVDARDGGLGIAPPDVFYAQLTARNRGLVDQEEQQRLRRTPILVAGCGSIGGAVVEPLVRLGAEHLLLAEPDGYELHNLNRQHAVLADVGRNKAQVLAERVRQINPHVQVRVDERGITAEAVADQVAGAGLVFDGVDVTSSPAPQTPSQIAALLHRSGASLLS